MSQSSIDNICGFGFLFCHRPVGIRNVPGVALFVRIQDLNIEFLVCIACSDIRVVHKDLLGDSKITLIPCIGIVYCGGRSIPVSYGNGFRCCTVHRYGRGPGITVHIRFADEFFHIVGADRQVVPGNLVGRPGFDFYPLVLCFVQSLAGGGIVHLGLCRSLCIGCYSLSILHIDLGIDCHTEDLVCKGRICGRISVHSDCFGNFQ